VGLFVGDSVGILVGFSVLGALDGSNEALGLGLIEGWKLGTALVLGLGVIDGV